MAARIVLIEDNKESLDLMSYLLRAFGHTVFPAGDGEEGLETGRRELPDLILSDLQMPKVDGYEVARAVRQDPRLANLPLVAVTAYAMRGDREHATRRAAHIACAAVAARSGRTAARNNDQAQPHSLS